MDPNDQPTPADTPPQPPADPPKADPVPPANPEPPSDPAPPADRLGAIEATLGTLADIVAKLTTDTSPKPRKPPWFKRG